MSNKPIYRRKKTVKLSDIKDYKALDLRKFITVQGKV